MSRSFSRQLWLAAHNTSNNGQMADQLDVCEEVTGIAVPLNEEVTELTGFLNEACDQVSIRATGTATIPEQYKDVTMVQNVADYFSRPILFSSPTYSNAARGPINNYILTNTTIQTALYNFSRVKGAFGWRATLCFRLQCISNPFQAGILRLAFSPLQGNLPNASTIERTVGITPVSQLPGVELDLAESTSAVLKIPFIHPLNYFSVVAPLTTPTPETFGTLSLYAYTPVALGAGASNPTLALWLWLEDFELVSATAAEFVTQSGIPSKKGKAASSKEADVIPGNLSNVLAAGAKFVSWAGSRIPVISSYAGPTSWFMRQASHIAASYGWSRPLTVLANNKMINTNNVYQNNSDGPDPSFNLGLFSDNAVAPMSGFAGSALDEMSFDYIKSVYSAITVGTLVTTDTVGLIKKSIQVTPSACWFQTGTCRSLNAVFPNGNSGKSFWPSTIFAMGNSFQYWRGGLKFRVKIAKTKFHTGRLVIGFMPYNTRASTTLNVVPTNPNNMQFKSIVWDLRESNTVEFECPFTAPISYLTFAQHCGTFFISVLDPLDGPTTVAQTVPYVVEVCGMDDFEVATPVQPVWPLSPQDTTYLAQSGMSDLTRTAPEHTPSLYCIGEKINSVKQMISRAGIFHIFTASGSKVVEPLFNQPFWVPTSAAPTAIDQIDSTAFNYWQSFYKFSRGGYHIHVVPSGTDCLLGAQLSANNTISGGSLITEMHTALHVKVPYYNQRSRDVVGDAIGNFGPSNLALVTFSKKAGSGTEAVVYYRAAEDFQLGYFVGAPPLCIPFDNTTFLDTTMTTVLTSDH